MKKTDSRVNKKLRLLPVRNLLIVLVSLVALMGVAELVLHCQLLFGTDADNDNAVLMSYEKRRFPPCLPQRRTTFTPSSFSAIRTTMISLWRSKPLPRCAIPISTT